MSQISKTGKVMPTKIGLHAFHINLYLYEFFELILFFHFFDSHGLKGNGPWENGQWSMGPWSERKFWLF